MGKGLEWGSSKDVRTETGSAPSDEPSSGRPAPPALPMLDLATIFESPAESGIRVLSWYRSANDIEHIKVARRAIGEGKMALFRSILGRSDDSKPSSEWDGRLRRRLAVLSDVFVR